MKERTIITRVVIILMMIQVIRAILFGFGLMNELSTLDETDTFGIPFPRIACYIEAIVCGILAIPVWYGVIKSKAFTGNLMFWYSIVIVWSVTIRGVVGISYNTLSITSVIFLFLFYSVICRKILKEFQEKHPEMCGLN